MKKLCVIIVEDEAIIRLNLKLILERINCDIIGETGRGEEAVAMAESLKPDFICMDIKLQGKINGIEAAMKIADFSKIPFIFMSAYRQKEIDKLADIKNKYIFLVKPIQKHQIEEAITTIMK